MKNLATIFITIQKASEQLEDLAVQILDAIREAGAGNLEEFNRMVSAAYDDNGWSSVAGRPPEGSRLKPAPLTIRNYVSIIRRAYKVNLDVTGFTTIVEMRKAIKMTREPLHGENVQPDALQGIHLSRANSMTGALWHDLVVVWDRLPDGAKESMEAKLQKLLEQFVKKAPELAIAA